MEASPTHRVLGADLRTGDMLIGRAVGGALADLSDCPARLYCGTVSALSERWCPITQDAVLDAAMHGGWARLMRVEPSYYYDIRRAA